MKIKICGITNIEDAQKIEALGGDYIGFIFEKSSPRYIDLPNAKAITQNLRGSIKKVGVFVKDSVEDIINIKQTCNLDVIQLHGKYTNQDIEKIKQTGTQVWKVVWLDEESDVKEALDFQADKILVDKKSGNKVGGSGELSNWELARILSEQRDVILAGGISQDNYKQAINEVKPYALDFNSKVELNSRKKDLSTIEKILKDIKRYGK